MVNDLSVDALSISGHKLGAPKGCGVAYLKSRTPAEPLIHGGGQERGRRAGTENVAGAVAMAMALELGAASAAPEAERVGVLREEFISHVLASVPNAILTGHRSQRLPSVASFCFPGTSGESVLLELERLGVVCSSGSACAAGSDEPSEVLLAIGLAREIAQTAVRFSFAQGVDAEQVRRAAALVTTAVERVTSLGAVGGEP